MRWKLIRRRFSIGAPRMIVRGHLPWPLRWAFYALMIGFSAAIALWAFEVGRELAGLDSSSKQELAKLRVEVADLRAERDKAQSIANTAESLLKAERAAQERLATQLKQAEVESMALKADLGFFERLLPAAGGDGPSVRAFQVEPSGSGQLRYQVLVMLPGKAAAAFQGRYEIQLTGLLDGKPWSQGLPGGARPLEMRQYMRIEGLIDHPAQVVVKTAQVRLTDNKGSVLASQTVKL